MCVNNRSPSIRRAMLPVGKDLISAFPALVTDSTLLYALQPEIRHNADGAALCILYIFRTLVSSRLVAISNSSILHES